MTAEQTALVNEGRDPHLFHAITAGIVAAIVGYTSSFSVVLAGLTAMGASPRQAGSGLLVVCLTMGMGCILFAWHTRIPIMMAWSTPGAALLASSAEPAEGFTHAVGAFIVAGLLFVLSGLIPALERAAESIPSSVANAMLAGVLLSICAAPFASLVDQPAAIAPVLLTWAAAMFVLRRWAVPLALLTAVFVMLLAGSFQGLSWAQASPSVEFVAPGLDIATVLAVGIPLWLVTMTSQNIPGIAVLRSFGYSPRLRPALLYSGSASAVGALAGGLSINLAAISAALGASPDAHPDRSRRWIAAAACGVVYMAFGLLSPTISTIAAGAPEGLLLSIAGLALIGTFATATARALDHDATREAAALTFIVAASGLTWQGVGAAFWALVAGMVWLGIQRWQGLAQRSRAEKAKT